MTNKINDGGPAFPTEQPVEFIQIKDQPDTRAPNRYGLVGGLTKREYFAGLMMQGILAHGAPLSFPADHYTAPCEQMDAEMAVKWADALIAALAAEQPLNKEPQP